MIDVETRLHADAEAWRKQAHTGYPALEDLLPPAQHRSAPVRKRLVAVAAGVAIIGSTAAVIAVSRSHGHASPAAPHVSHSAAPLRPIFIDGRTFSPRRTPLRGSLSAAAAWAAATRHRPMKYRHVPAGATVMFGEFTEPARLHDEHVWAYGVVQGCAFTGVVAPPSPLPRCTEWIFLDAYSGKLVLDTSVPD